MTNTPGSRNLHVLVVTEHNMTAPMFGGALRTASLACELAAHGDRVSVLRFRRPSESPSHSSFDFAIHDIEVPGLYDVPLVGSLFHRISRTADRLAGELATEHPVDVVQSEMPWPSITGLRLARTLNVPHVLLSHNCESALAATLSHHSVAKRLPIVGPFIVKGHLELLRSTEHQAVARSARTFTPSPVDRAEMSSQGIPTNDVEVLKNGTSVRQATREMRHVMRKRLGLKLEQPVAIFVGRMDYPPNLAAVQSICQVIAPSCPEVAFLLVGSNPPSLQVPTNVQMVGRVETVDPYLRAADLAIVPIDCGSGTRIKILDAWAAGLPVLSTSTGASGLEYRNGESIWIEDNIHHFAQRIQQLFLDYGGLQTMGRYALDASESYRWDTIGATYHRALMSIATG